MFFSPLREEKNPSFYVQRSDGYWTWKDWGIGQRGDIINFVELYYGIDFTEAVRRIGVLPSTDLSTSDKAFKYGLRKETVNGALSYSATINRVREFYRKGALMSFHKMDVVRGYFLRMGVRYYPEMKCILLNDWKEKRVYVGIPVPFPLKIRGLELREVFGNSRKTWGRKALWLLRRNPRRVLVAESVLDALSGELVIGDDSITLCSLNGVCNVGQLEDLFVQYRPEEVILALDGDEAGRKATCEAVEIAKCHAVPVIEFTGHLDAGVKDLHKLLMLKEESLPAAGREVWKI